MKRTASVNSSKNNFCPSLSALVLIMGGICMIIFLPFLITIFGFWGGMTWDTWLALVAVTISSLYLVGVGLDDAHK